MKIFKSIALLGALFMTTSALAAESISSYLKYFMPGKEECTLEDTYGRQGLGCLIMACNDILSPNRESTGKVELFYSETENGERTLIGSVGLEENEEMGVQVIGFSAADDTDPDDPNQLQTNTNCYFLFVRRAQLDAGGAAMAKFKKPGYYYLVIPDGGFGLLDNNKQIGTLLDGATIPFHLSEASNDHDFTYTVDPVSGTEITSLIKHNQFTMTLTFPGTSSVSWANSVRATLTNGNSTFEQSYPSMSGNKFTFVFGKKSKVTSDNFAEENPDWVNGTYELNIPANKLIVDYNPIHEYDEGNVPAISDIYFVVNAATSGVGTILNSANKGAIYDLDGRMVVSEGSEADLLSLPAGVYVINGKKYIKK